MLDSVLKNKTSLKMNQSVNKSPDKKSSKFHALYNEAFRQVQKKISRSENFPLIKMKSYQQPANDLPQLKEQNNFSQSFNSMNIFTSRQNISKFPTNKRSFSSLNKKSSVNKVLWQKKMSLQTLRISSSSNKFKNSQNLREIQRKSLKSLRQKTSQEKLLKQDEDNNFPGQFSILPLNLTTSRQYKQKFLEKKKKIQEKFKITFFDDKDKEANKINFIRKIEKNQFWQIQKDENQFVNFVKDRISSNF